MNIELARISVAFFEAGEVIEYPGLVQFYQDPPLNSGRFWHPSEGTLAFEVDPTVVGQKIKILQDATFISVRAIGDGMDPGFTDGAMASSLQIFYAPVVIKKSIPRLLEIAEQLYIGHRKNDPNVQFIAAFSQDREDTRLWNYVGRLKIDDDLLSLLVDR